jgi:hypothetical protein
MALPLFLWANGLIPNPVDLFAQARCTLETRSFGRVELLFLIYPVIESIYPDLGLLTPLGHEAPRSARKG